MRVGAEFNERSSFQYRAQEETKEEKRNAGTRLNKISE